MPIDVLMPKLSPTMSEGRFAGWLVKEGDSVSAGDIIAEVETDKATMEVEATEDGVIHKLIGEKGTDIQVGAPIAVMKADGEDVPADYEPVSKVVVVEASLEEESTDASSSKEVSSSPVATAPAIQKTASKSPELPTAPASSSVTSNSSSNGRVVASPLAKRMAVKEGVDLSMVTGTGPKGRIVKQDVENAMRSGGSGSKSVVRGQDYKVAHTPMRKAIANRLTESKQQVPHFYLSASVEMDNLLNARQQLNALGEGRYKISVNDLIIKACGLALKKNPEANGSWYDDAVVQYGNVDISVAVAIEGGLITPIVANADQKGIVQISNEMKSLAGQAREGTLKPEQYQGGGFSISNLGMYGVKSFQAIVNPPQGAILAVGASEERVVAKNGQMQVAHVMDISMSVDHRVVDGAVGAELLRDIKFYLENPVAMLV